jgi:hypothetical protein
MPAFLGRANSISGLKSALDQPEFATAIGLVKFGSFQQRKGATSPVLSLGGVRARLTELFKKA